MKNKQIVWKMLQAPTCGIILIVMAIGLAFSQVKAQQITVGNGVHFINNAHVNGGGIVNQGTIHNGSSGVILITGNWQNDGNCTGTASSTITFAGAATQQIGGSSITTFENLTLNNTSGFLLVEDAMVNGVLNFQNGVLSTGTNLLTIGYTGIITNASAIRYVDGRLANTFSSAGSKIFPIGKGGNYRPLTLQFSDLTGTSVVTAEQFETPLAGDLPENATLLTTGRHWKLTETGGSEIAYSITLDPTDYTPERPVVLLKQDDGAVISVATTTPTYTNALTFNSFSEFGLGEECINPIDGGLIAGEQSSCESFVPDEITNEELPGGHIGVLEYQWQMSITDNDADFDNILGANSVSFSPGTVTQTTWYRRLARVTCNPVDWSSVVSTAAVKITVEFPPSAYAGTDAIICEYDSHALSHAEATHYSQLLWESSGSGSFDDPGILHPTYTPSAADALSGEVSLTLTASAIEPCEFIATSSLTLTIWLLPEIINQPESQMVCESSDVEFSVIASGTAPLSYKWRGPTGWIDGNENPTLQLYNVSTADAGKYFVVVATACGRVVSESAILTIQEPPLWDQTTLPQNQIATCDDVPEAEILTATGDSGESLNVDFAEIRTDGECAGNYSLTRTWMAADSCGNTISHTQILIVEDTQAPYIINPEITSQELNQSKIVMNLEDAAAFDASVLETEVASLYQDDCSEPVIAVLINTSPGEDNSNAFWSFAYEFSISDKCGNSTSCEVMYSGGFLEFSGFVVTNTQCYGSEGVIIADDLIVEPGGDIILVAGVSVSLKVGVQVLSGGRLHAYISNEYCENPTPLVVSKEDYLTPQTESKNTNQKASSFNLYPNPTTGVFTLEFINGNDTGEKQVELYNMMGELIIKKEIKFEQTCLFDIADNPPGIYIIRLLRGNVVETLKVVKQ